MNPSSTALVRFSVLLVAILLSAAHSSAQFPRLNDLASEIVRQVKPLKPRLVAVTDFRPPNTFALPQGHYFAWVLSSMLQDRAKKSFTVADHISFDSDLAKLNILGSSLVPGEALQSAAPHLGADVLIIGSFERRDNAYFLRALPVIVANSRSLDPIETKIDTPEFLDSLVTPLPENIPRRTSQENIRGDTTMPTCARCPEPDYTGLARHNHLEGSVIFMVLVTADGLPGQIRPVQLIGDGLDETAFEAIKRCSPVIPRVFKRFRPLKQNGAPVPTIVPIEITFRLD
jgi:hypothetical protein